MNAQAIQSTDILVRFANRAEDGKPPNIRTTDGATYGVKPADFGRFQPGGRYRIDYVEKQGRGKWQGRTFRDIVKCEPLTLPATEPTNLRPAPAAGAPSGGAPSEFEFVIQMLVAYVRSGGVKDTVESLVTRARSLRTVYREVWP